MAVNALPIGRLESTDGQFAKQWYNMASITQELATAISGTL
jgi:hypothetical protein